MKILGSGSRAATSVVGLALAAVVIAACATDEPAVEEEVEAATDDDEAEGEEAREEPSDDDVISIDVGHNQGTVTDVHQVALEVAERVSENSDGSIELNIFPDSQLGSLTDVADQFMLGAPSIGYVNAPMSADRGVPELEAAAAMYAFSGSDEIMTFASSDLMQQWEEELYDQGYVLLAFNWYLGERHIISDNPDGYPSPEDMSGDAMRIPVGPTWAAFFDELPIDAQTIDGSEVYTSIQQGVINGAEGPYSQMLGWSLQELSETVSLTAHGQDITGFATGSELWDSLNGEQQEVLREAFRWGGEQFTTRTIENAADQRQELEDAGITFVEVDRDAYQAIADSVYTEENFPEWGDGALDRVREAAGR